MRTDIDRSGNSARMFAMLSESSSFNPFAHDNDVVKKKRNRSQLGDRAAAVVAFPLHFPGSLRRQWSFVAFVHFSLTTSWVDPRKFHSAWSSQAGSIFEPIKKPNLITSRKVFKMVSKRFENPISLLSKSKVC